MGPIIDASAYAFAPQVVVAPFACLDVIFNVLTAPYTLPFQQAQVTRDQWLGSLLVFMGAACTAGFGSVQDDVMSLEDFEKKLKAPRALIYIGVEIAIIIVVRTMWATGR